MCLCQQEGDPMPEDWRTLVDSDLFRVDTSKVPEVTATVSRPVLVTVTVRGPQLCVRIDRLFTCCAMQQNTLTEAATHGVKHDAMHPSITLQLQLHSLSVDTWPAARLFKSTTAKHAAYVLTPHVIKHAVASSGTSHLHGL